MMHTSMPASEYCFLTCLDTEEDSLLSTGADEDPNRLLGLGAAAGSSSSASSFTAADAWAARGVLAGSG